MSTDTIARVRGEDLRRGIARILLHVDPGQRLPTVRDLAARFGVSIGAAQEALVRLESDGAIAVDRRGRGAILLDRSPGQLWSIAEASPLIISLPLPSTTRIEGLATAVKAQLAASGVEAFMIFSRGSRNRLVELRQQRCHAAVMSALAATELCGPGEEAVLELPPFSFVREHRVYFVDGDRPSGEPLRVAVDRDSLDFQLLTELEFRDSGATFVSATYMESPRLLEERRAEAVVWDVEEGKARMPSFVRDRPLSKHVLDQIGTSDLSAAFVTRRSDASVRRLFQICLDVDALMRLQDEVMAGRHLPAY